jgi:hypothetical protein
VENKSAEIQQLTTVIQQKDQELAACANKLADSDRDIKALRATMEDMRAEIRQLTENVQKAEREFEDRQTRWIIVDEQRELAIAAIIDQARELRCELATQKERNRRLEAGLAPSDPTGEYPLGLSLTDARHQLDGRSKLIDLPPHAKEVLYAFYQGYALCQACSLTSLAPAEIFGMLQSLIVPSFSQLAHGIDVPVEWGVDHGKLLESVRNFHFCWHPHSERVSSCAAVVPNLLDFLPTPFASLVNKRTGTRNRWPYS